MKIGFYLLGEKAFKVIDGFIKKFGSQNIGFVVIGKDKNIANDYSEEIINLTSKHSIKVFDRNEKVTVNSGYNFSVGWRWLIDAPNLIVFHDSLLPRYRGFAPLVNMLINGEENIGVTALMAVNEYDAGPIISQEKLSIEYPIKIQKAIELVSELYLKLVLSITKQILSQSDIPLFEQNHSDASYSLWRDELDYAINWKGSSTDILRFINAVGYPFRGASSYLNSVKVRILSAEIYDDVEVEARSAHIGKIIFMDKGVPVVVCGQGLLKITHINSDNSTEKIKKIPFRSRFS